ncbi:hypothetical protein [Psychroflexus lacisalsi]|jgi:hypothetical protein|uniref:Uncharacterized protein n=1 Tax=Psychroflexus lacisalsi TaxID=503928 RepID=A0ABN1K7U1_9FLAO|nr:hypothetical protein [Psychroflexus lacisalsi]MBZ9619533.1 hypothetical protein [Psychroflexus lacisalsi]
MKSFVFILGVLLLSIQFDYYQMDLIETSIVLEIEENNTLVEEYVITYHNLSSESNTFPETLKVWKSYILTFDQIHLDQEIEPPEALS